MIWQWSPRRKTLIIPEVKMTIPGIKTMDKAKDFMATFKPEEWTYVVKSKTGSKLHPFTMLEDAENMAKAKSSKRSSYSVYRDGKCVATFVAGKKLPMWKKVYVCRYDQDYEEEYVSERCNRYEGKAIPRGSHLIEEGVACIDTALKVYSTRVEIIETAEGKIARKYSTDSVTYHKNGQCFVYNSYFRHVRQAGNQSCPLLAVCANSHNKNKLFDKVQKGLMWLYPDKAYIVKEADDWDNLDYAVRHPSLAFAVDRFKKTAKKRNLPNWVFGDKVPKEIVDEKDILNIMIMHDNVPAPKSLRKLYVQDNRNIRIVHNIASIGITDVNHMLKCSHIGRHMGHSDWLERQMRDLIQLLIAARGEAWVANHAEKESAMDLIDSARMLGGVESEIVNCVLKEARNFAEIHDSLQHYRNMKGYHRKVNKEIPYDEDELERFNRSYGDIRFELAKDCVDLAVVGQRMGICVGGYADEACARRTTIVKMMKGDKHVACIEVRDDGIRQIKSSCNNMLELKYKPALDNWISDTKLDIITTDYSRIGTKWENLNNYAYILPEDYVEEDNSVFRVVKSNPRLNNGYPAWYGTDIPEEAFAREFTPWDI